MTSRGVLPALVFALALALLAPVESRAQLPTRATMPDSVVLMVRAVDPERVVPTTGVVIGRNGTGDALVIVPADFADGEGDLYALDGGTDFQTDGLPARRVSTPEDTTLALLAVPDLTRPPIRVTFNPPETDHEVRLAAWPPADMMAAGAMPFWVPVDVAGKTTGAAQTLVPGESLPNLTGPLIDLCEHWAGMVIATGEPGIEGGPPQVVLNDALLALTEPMGINLRLEACMQVAPVGGIVSETVITPAQAQGPGVKRTGFRAILDEANLGLGAVVFLLSAVISGIAFWLIIKRRAATQRRQKIQRTLQAETIAFSADGLPTRATRAEKPTTFVEPSTRPTGGAGWLRIEGTHADGRPLRAITPIHDGKFQAVIGRAGVQLSADGPGISRKHAVIVGEGGRFTLSDLGSRNGTFLNGVRCQRDEVFYVREGDTILLGAAEVKVRLSPARGAGT
ncbi:MAG: FHA domain-containing protein [Xanthomonadales bacterium]|nr:FHA domain-containing protein [Xanthomonadales bacterium]